MAQHQLQVAVDSRLGPRAWTVRSAGTRADPGRAAHPLAEQVLLERGLTAVGTTSRLLTPDLIRAADLVLTAERAHRAAVVSLVPAALGRSFTLRQFARLADHVEPLTGADPVELGRVLIERAKLARGLGPVAGAEDDDLPDPIGRPLGAYQTCAATLDDVVARIVRPLPVLVGA